MNDCHELTEVLAVLVAGHRTDRLGGDVSSPLQARLENVLSAIDGLSKERSAALRILTGVAEGTDVAATAIADRLNIPLHLIAPGLPQTLTRTQQRADRIVWLGAPDVGAHGDEAYAVRDEMALCFADLLVVVWDGESPHGLAGGTVRLVFQAALMMRPVVWIGTDGSVRILDRCKLDEACLHKLRGPHPETDWLKACFSTALEEPALTERLAAEISLTLNPAAGLIPLDSDDLGKRRQLEQEKFRLEAYRAKASLPMQPTRAGQVHESLMSLMRGDLPRLWKQRSPIVPEAYWGPAQPKQEDRDLHPIQDVPLFDDRFTRSDVKANLAAGYHRDFTWLIYGASAFAVFAAVAGSIHLWPGGHGPLWALVELLLIGGIIGGLRLAKSRNWHELWIGHRFVAEQLRYARMCLPLMGLPRLFMSPFWGIVLDKKGESHLRLESPELWWVQRTLIAQGLPVAIYGREFSPSQPQVLAVLKGYVSRVIADQKGWHGDNHTKWHKLHHHLHLLAVSLFAATVLAVLVHFIRDARLLLICTAVFPALAAAIHGLATKLEMVRIAGQSAVTAQVLTDLERAIDCSGHEAGWSDWLRLRHLALEAARAMSDENDQWQQLIRDQGADLPA
jgi:hypothetical protein